MRSRSTWPARSGLRRVRPLHLDHRRRLRMEHALAKDGSVLRRSAFEIVILDRGDEPDVGVVEEGLKVRATEGLARLALGRHGLADRRQVDGAEVRQEGVGRAQPDLRRSQGSSFAWARKAMSLTPDPSPRRRPCVCLAGHRPDDRQRNLYDDHPERSQRRRSAHQRRRHRHPKAAERQGLHLPRQVLQRHGFERRRQSPESNDPPERHREPDLQQADPGLEPDDRQGSVRDHPDQL